MANVLCVCFCVTGCGTASSSGVEARTLSDNAAMQRVKDMKIGWNLGNAMDSVDFKKYSPQAERQKRNSYQIMGVYASAPWTSWDASAAPFFNTAGSVNFEWKIEKLNSSGPADKLSFQVFNHNLKDVGDNLLGIQIKDAYFVKADGEKILFADACRDYYLHLTDGVSDYIDISLKDVGNLLTTENIIGGTLYATATITQYPEPADQTDQMVSANEYYETLWGNVETTKEVIDAVADKGFKTVRVPVSFYDHTDPLTGKIDEEWLKREKEIVDWVLDNDMYCIIDMHHEDVWLKADSDSYEQEKIQFEQSWKQISEYFRDYDTRLMFEGFNEVKNNNGDTSTNSQQELDIINKLNQLFVDTVRSTGGNNNERFLLLSTYAANIDENILGAFVLPQDTISDHLIVDVHTYAPLAFCWNKDKVTWTETYSDWDETKDGAGMKQIYDRLDTYFISKGVPVVIGEFAAWNKGNTKDRAAFAEYVVKTSGNYGITCLWWDDGGQADNATKVSSAAILNRTNGTWYFPEIADALVGASDRE